MYMQHQVAAEVIVWFVRLPVQTQYLAYCTSMHLHIVHYEIFNVKHCNVNERRNKYLHG